MLEMELQIGIVLKEILAHDVKVNGVMNPKAIPQVSNAPNYGMSSMIVFNPYINIEEEKGFDASLHQFL